MLKRLAACLLLFATAAFGHQGVVNPTVLARMSGMADIDAAMGVLVGMASGEAEYDRAAAIRARRDLLDAVADIPVLFAMPENDPSSNSRPEIWTRPPGFSLNAAEALLLVDELDPTSLDGLQTSLIRVEQTCVQCHDTYRLHD